MRDLINLVAAHGRACHLRMIQLSTELAEVRKMERERELEYGRLQQQAAACRTMLRTIRDDLPSGESREALDQLLKRLEQPGESVEDEAPPWDDEDVLDLPKDDRPAWEAPNRYPETGWEFWRR